MRATDSRRPERDPRRAMSVTDDAIDKIRELIVSGQ